MEKAMGLIASIYLAVKFVIAADKMTARDVFINGFLLTTVAMLIR